MVIAAIVQARSGSKRLPNKIFKTFCGKSMLEHIYYRLRHSKKLNDIIIASPPDKDIANVCVNSLFCSYWQGSEEDVLDRYYQAAKHYEVDVIVRITADCPLIDVDELDKAIDIYLRGTTDYLTNDNFWGKAASGFDFEIFSFKTLERVWLNAKRTEYEHVVAKHIAKNRNDYTVTYYKMPEWCYDNHLSVDTEGDLKLITEIYESNYFHKLGYFGLNEVKKHLSNRNEYVKTLEGIAK